MDIRERLNNTTPIILGISGKELTREEKECLTTVKPFGIILFKKNLSSEKQIQELTSSIKASSPDTKVFIDQEGGRVQRIKPKNGGSKNYPPQKHFGDLYKSNLNKAEKELYDSYHVLGIELKKLGIDVTCAPVCDLYYSEQDLVIGDRAFSNDPDIVIYLANIALKALQDSGIEGVIKHIPGHGRATKDSHKELPRVDSCLKELEEADFKVFRNLSSNDSISIAMTAHIVFSSLDDQNPVTQSKKSITYIRQKIGFEGLVITDDIGMNALSGSIRERAKKSFDAGCDIVTYCKDINKDTLAELGLLGSLLEKNDNSAIFNKSKRSCGTQVYS